ncbi:hypothetical protein [Escherichia coli]
MKHNTRKEIINRLIRDYNFKEENNYLRYGVCPQWALLNKSNFC